VSETKREWTVEQTFEDAGLAVEVSSSVGTRGRKFYSLRVGRLDKSKVVPAFHPGIGIFTERSEDHSIKLKVDYAAVFSTLLLRAQGWVTTRLEQERAEFLASRPARREHDDRGHGDRPRNTGHVMRPGKTAREREKQRAKATAAAAPKA
jgi:hypothetical protein